jgi:hypothetical protein
MQVVVLNHSIIRDSIASVHKQGCGAIEREALSHGSSVYGPYESVEAALADYIDSEMEEMGYDRRDVKVHACCKS